ncbi:PIN domain-containing protein [Methylocapsa acidiphila]|uniref:PIN domain-containing protein n=1 Tax=Methylocapsa acidiphila TaxID=133552 RepID=UPI000415D901|nr:PIN domain-containing protein [Methylocapsa acidiphila]
MSAGNITRDFLSGFEIIGVDERIAARAVGLRRRHKIKLPDAVIWASARDRAMLLVTHDVKNFPSGDPGVRIPYAL